jgi:phosphoglycerol transferase MdoB-like AlkP superfamily enzyme
MTSSISKKTSPSHTFSYIYSFGLGAVKGNWKEGLLPFFSTLTIYGICFLISKYAAGLNYDIDAILRDLFLQVVLAYILFVLFQRRWAFIVFQALIVGFFFLGHATKVSFHGVPLSPDDMYAISDLFWILEKWQRTVMVLYGVSLLFLIIIGTHRRRIAYCVLISVAAGFFINQKAVSLTYFHLVKNYDISVWDMRGNLVNHGATLHSLLETLRYASDSRKPPTANEVNEALTSLEKMRIHTTKFPLDGDFSGRMRNIHIILLESFWDVSQLSGAKFSRSPFDATFLELWKRTGYSKCMTPVYGGYTANSEFEALAGFPVDENGVRFERGLRNDIPAVPRLLSDRGYKTVASHPNVAGFWNRTNAYRRIGFQTYWSIDHFDLNDMNNGQLSDESLYFHVLKKIDPILESGKPLLNYIVTYTGHIPYILNSKRPHLIQTESKLDVVENYANTIYYKS